MSTKDVLNKNAAKEKDSALEKGTNVVNEALDSFTKEINGVTNSVTEGVSAATSLISGTASSLTKSMTDTVTSFTKDAQEMVANSKLGSVLDSVTEGTKETIGKVESLIGSTAEAVMAPVAFVTKTASDLLSPFTGNKDTSSIADGLLKGKTGEQLSTLATKTGISTNSSSGFMSAIGKVTSFVSGGIKSATSTISGVIKTVTGTVSSITGAVTGAIDTVTSTAGAIVNGVKSTVSGIVTGVTSQASDLLHSCCDALPEPFKGKLRNAGEGAIGKVSSYLKSTTESIGLKIPNTAGVMSALLKSNSVKSTTSSYPRYTDATGAAFTGISTGSTVSQKEANTFYQAAQLLCPNTQKPTFSDFRTNKDMYDVLLQLAGTNSMTDLLSQLLDCNKMFDGRSEALLRQLFPTAVENGDPYLYQTVLKGTGAEKIAAPLDELRMLNANMTLENGVENTTDKLNTYKALTEKLNVTVKSMAQGQTYGTTTAWNAPAVVAMSANNTTVIDEGIGKDTRMMGLQLFHAYA